MARRPTSSSVEPVSKVMGRHLKALGLGHHSLIYIAQHYADWCRDAGVRVGLDKSAEEREAELEIFAQRKAAEVARTQIRGNPRKFIELCCAEEINPDSLDNPMWQHIAMAIRQSPNGKEDRKSLCEFLLYLDKVSDLVFERVTDGGQIFATGLVRLHERRGQWIRAIKDWRPSTKNWRGRYNSDRQFAALLRHLLAKYPVPAFLDAAWTMPERGGRRYRDWFIHIGLGYNFREAKGLPYPITKTIAHHFVNAPADFTIEGALMLADVQAIGGGPRLAKALMGTRLGQTAERDPDRRAFWLSVYRFFIANPMLDLAHAGPIVDFLTNQKFEDQEVMIEPGIVETRPPPQPGLSMSGRNPATLLQQVEAWHGDLRRSKLRQGLAWRSSGITGLLLETGPRDDPARQVTWRTRELLNSDDLHSEGNRMRHCVGSYARSCANGRCSIWSLERQTGQHGVYGPALTIEVDAYKQAVQARGPMNRPPNEAEKAVLETWFKKAAIQAGPYLFAV